MNKNKRVSITDVAKHAKVSIATVSRALNKTSNILPKTEEKVFEAVHALNYIPNVQAQNLRGGNSDILGFLISPDIVSINDFQHISSVLYQLSEAVSEEGYHLISETLQSGASSEIEIPKIMKERRCCGYFLLGYLSEKSIEILLKEGAPLCLLGSYGILNDKLFSIEFDFKSGMNDVIQYLSALGHRRISLVHGNLEYPVNSTKKEGFLETIREFGLDEDKSLLFCLDNEEQNFTGGRKATSKLLSLKNPPSAICYVNDWIALGGICEAESRGIRIPEDLSIVGFDNSFVSEQSSPGITSVSTSFKSMAHVAADLMMRKIHNLNIRERATLLPVQLIRRKSCNIFKDI